MVSTISWLDQSAEEQRRVRELVGLFSESESRDELGIGQVRDVFSNRLFPGTSVIQTRTRYFLFIPWLFQQHQAKRRSGADLLRRVQESERQLIATMLAADHKEGLIGRDAGTRVKTLPTSIYWNGLQQFGVLRQPVGPDAITSTNAGGASDLDAEDERADRAPSVWHPTLPDPPDGFPAEVPGGFALTAAEAAWFRDLTLERSPGTLLAHLMAANSSPDADSSAPWADSVAVGAPEPVASLLEEARRFSLVMHGAALLYNLLLAEAYEAAGYDAITAPTEDYREQLAGWSEEVAANRDALAAWDFEPWWADIQLGNPRIGPLTRTFIREWLELTHTAGSAGIVDHAQARILIKNRERVTKKGQARLANDRLLRAWNGASGSRRLVYRWGTVRRLVADVVEALEVDDARS